MYQVYIAGLKYRENCRQSFVILGILTLPPIYILQCLSTAHGDVHSYPTRNSTNLVPNRLRLHRSRSGTTYYRVKFSNMLPRGVRHFDEKHFKKQLQDKE